MDREELDLEELERLAQQHPDPRRCFEWREDSTIHGEALWVLEPAYLIVSTSTGTPGGDDDDKETAEYIAAACKYFPALLSHIRELEGALNQAEYAIRHASGETKHPTDGRPFCYEDFQVWAEQWLPVARRALKDIS